MSLVAAGEAYEGERLGAFVDVPGDVCLLAYARASASVEDLDVAVFSDEGTPLAVDEAPDSHPTVMLCPPHPDRVYVSAHAASGEGLVAVAAQLVPQPHADEVATRLGARGGPAGGPRDADGWPGLDDVVREHRAALGGSWEDFRKVALPVDTRSVTTAQLPVEPGKCTDAVIVPNDEVALLDVELDDEAGRVIARAQDGGRLRSLTVCSSVAIDGVLLIRPHLGHGLAALVLGRGRGDTAHDLSARPDVVWAVPTQPVEVRRQAKNAELAKQGYAPPAVTLAGTLALGRRASLPLDLRAAGQGCARVDVVAGAPLALVDAELWDDAGALVGSGEGSAEVTIFACGRPKAVLDLESRGRPGPFAVLVRPEGWKDAAFTAAPLAASRMLARAADGPSSLLQGTARSVRGGSLDAAHEMTWGETVPAGKCLRVTAGAQGDGTGLELRLADAASGEELDRSHAADAVSVRGCAPEAAARDVRVELRATSGKLDVVVGERTSD
jgi:hypothetical protein